MDWMNAVIQGVLLGGLYALFAAGLSLVFGIMRVVNLAHGDFIILAAFLSVVVFVVGVLAIAGLQMLFTRTALGRAFRATADDQETVRLMGIDNRHTYGLAVAIAFGIVALAGVCLGIRTTFSPDIGPGRLLVAFETVVIGGLGSLWGTLMGGVILGIAHTIGAKLDPAYRELTGHLVFLRSEEHTSELQSLAYLVCRLLLEKKKKRTP